MFPVDKSGVTPCRFPSMMTSTLKKTLDMLEGPEMRKSSVCIHQLEYCLYWQYAFIRNDSDTFPNEHISRTDTVGHEKPSGNLHNKHSSVICLGSDKNIIKILLLEWISDLAICGISSRYQLFLNWWDLMIRDAAFSIVAWLRGYNRFGRCM
jgi:hypothetical protein